MRFQSAKGFLPCATGVFRTIAILILFSTVRSGMVPVKCSRRRECRSDFAGDRRDDLLRFRTV